MSIPNNAKALIHSLAETRSPADQRASQDKKRRRRGRTDDEKTETSWLSRIGKGSCSKYVPALPIDTGLSHPFPKTTISTFGKRFFPIVIAQNSQSTTYDLVWNRTLPIELSLNWPAVDELYSVYETAEARISRPPYPSIERLEPKFQVAHEIYKSIPHKLSAAGRAQANKPSGGWF